MKNLFVRFVREDAGQDLIEYALLTGFISLVAVGAITTVGTNLDLCTRPSTPKSSTLQLPSRSSVQLPVGVPPAAARDFRRRSR